ncbi:Ubiquitin-like protein 4A [Echinococcus granulosus]|uniref:Ubiquitin-like protein 4A n=2 Tax=Echinococcus granulosus TaxID=6210 RepID=W6ULE6_ECHGR|nr:Ubiquitin-like protein 4A [Echinococcus granulosus]EUB54354.1 Ubiquitin-like protein 4A [Echinococcus granulosus]
MKISVKRLGQPAKIMNVTEMTTVGELLPQISSDSGVESERISLIFNGTPLSDKNRSLKDYSIKSGDRIMVVVKASLTPNFEQILQKYLQASYNTHDAKAITSKFMSLLSKTLDSLSIDDIDRLANAFSESY